MRTSKDFSTFFIFIVYGVSEGRENLLLVLLGSVGNVLSTEYRRVGRLFLLWLLGSVEDIFCLRSIGGWGDSTPRAPWLRR